MPPAPLPPTAAVLGQGRGRARRRPPRTDRMTPAAPDPLLPPASSIGWSGLPFFHQHPPQPNPNLNPHPSFCPSPNPDPLEDYKCGRIAFFIAGASFFLPPASSAANGTALPVPLAF